MEIEILIAFVVLYLILSSIFVSIFLLGMYCGYEKRIKEENKSRREEDLWEKEEKKSWP